MAERILIVEDEAATREGLAFHLRTLGYEVAVAEDGPTALAALQKHPADILLLDLVLPGEMDGIHLLRIAREIIPHVGAIVITGYPSAENTLEALRLRAYDYVIKPFDLDRLGHVLAHLVEKLRLERQVAEANCHLENIYRTNPVAINAIDLAGRFTHWGSERLLGYTAEEIVGRATPEAFIVTPGYDLQADLEACRREGGTVREYQMRRKDGQLLRVREERVRLLDRHGRHIGYTAHLLDVTEEGRMQEQRERDIGELTRGLEDRRRELEAVRAVAHATWRLISLPELLTAGLESLLTVVPGASLAWCFLLEGEESVEDGLILVATEAGRRILLGGCVQKVPVPGMLPGDLRESGSCECIRLLMQTDTEGLTPTVIPCLRLNALGVPASGAKPHHLTLPMVVHGRTVGVLNVAKEDYAPFSAEEITLLEILADQFTIGIVNARLEAVYRELRESQRRTVQMDRLRTMGELASGVAHDFNNLLTTILGSTQLLLRREEDPHLLEELRIIERAAQDGGETVRRILEFTRTRRDRDAVPVDLSTVARETAELTRGRWRNGVQARGATIHLRLDLQPVPHIFGNPSELREMLTNLILNAVEAMPAGGILTLATLPLLGGTGDLATRQSGNLEPGTAQLPGRPITQLREAEWVELRVTDTGVGMPPDVVERIFDPFFSTKEGMGLGLSVAYVIVQRHEGDILVTSTPGQGTTFALRFPVAGGATPTTETPPAPALARSARILVVDDEVRLAQMLGSVLEAQGHRVLAATSGKEAMALLRAHRFDLMMTDLGMPGMSGWDVAREAQAIAPGLPVVLITGWGAQIDPQEAGRAGIARVVQKPYNIETIQRVVAEVLSPGRASRKAEGPPLFPGTRPR